jgi:alpha-glucosidase
LTFRREGALTSRFAMLDSAISEHDETYNLVVGKTRNARDHFRELRVKLQESVAPRRRLDLAFRAYDDGAAFRYILPAGEPNATFEIVQENTRFHFPADLEALAFNVNTFRSSFEGEYLPTRLDAIPDKGLVYPPLTLQRPDGLTLAITEAALTDYAGMYFRGLPGTALEVVLPPWSDGSGVCVRGVTPFSSPWRVIMIGDKPGDLIESTLIQNLNAPCALEDVSWIRPGKTIFPWWPDFFSDKPGVESKMGFENQKY